jgi:predicted nucleotidyltransferase
VFGSTALGEAGLDSDVDLLVEFDPARVPGWEYFSRGDELALVMQRPVGVVTPKSLPRLMRDSVLREVVYA